MVRELKWEIVKLESVVSNESYWSEGNDANDANETFGVNVGLSRQID